MSESNRKWWTLGAVAFGLFMIMLDNTIVTVALPTIKAAFNIKVSKLEWIVTAYTLTFATFILVGGKLADRLGRRLLLNVGLTIFTISSLVCGLAGHIDLLIGARAVQGVGAAIMVPSTLSIVTAAFPPRQRGTAIGIWAGTAGMAIAIGPLLGGILTQKLSWHWIFYVNIPVGVLAIAAARIVITESRDTSREQSLDLAGLLTSSLSLFALTYALIEGNGRGWSSPLIVALFVASAVLMLVFILLELRQRLPMLDLSLFKIGNFVGSVLVALLVSFSMYGVFFFMSLYVQNVLGYSPIRTGVIFLPMTALIILVAPAAGRLSDYIGSRWIMAGGMTLVAVSLYLFSGVGMNTTFSDLLPAMIIGGIGIPMAMSPTTAAAMATVPVDRAGVGSAVLNSFRQVGGSMGVALLGAIMIAKSTSFGNALEARARAAHVHPTAQQTLYFTHEAFVHGLHTALLVSVGISLGAALIGAVLVRKKHHEHAEGPLPSGELA